MGIVPPSLEQTPYIDYGHAIKAMSPRDFARFASLSDTPHAFDLEAQQEYTFGEERDFPLSARQIAFLTYRAGVYFPWRVYLELLPGGAWTEKSDPKGKAWSKDALVYFPRTVAFVRSLPFKQIGSVKLLGLDADHHGTVHRDGDDANAPPAQFITFSPRGNKRLFLWDEETKTKAFAPKHAYWFHDHNYHGVEPDPFFRYSLRVDGSFEEDFLENVA